MALARVKNWVAEVLTYSDLNAEFNNILNATVFSFGSEFINFAAASANPTPAQLEDLRVGFLVPSRAYRQRQIRFGIRFDF